MPDEVAAWLAAQTPHTRKAYTTDWAAWVRWLAANGYAGPFDERVKRAVAEEWQRSLLVDGYAPSTVNRRIASAASCYTYCEVRNPCRKVRVLPTGATQRVRWLTPDELVMMTMHVEAFDLRHRLMWHLMLHGLRVAEVTGMLVGDVKNRGETWIMDVRGKGGKVRTLPVMPSLVSVVLERREEWPAHDEPLVASTQGRRLSESAVRKMVSKLARCAGVARDQVSPHDIRRAVASAAWRGNADIVEIQRMLGHSSIATTQRYLRPIEAEENEALDVAMRYMGMATGK